MMNGRKQTCWMTRSRDMGNAVKIESLQKFKNSDEKEDGSADAKSLVLQLDCSALMV